jgi:hypothetical protein
MDTTQPVARPRHAILDDKRRLSASSHNRLLLIVPTLRAGLSVTVEFAVRGPGDGARVRRAERRDRMGRVPSRRWHWRWLSWPSALCSAWRRDPRVVGLVKNFVPEALSISRLPPPALCGLRQCRGRAPRTVCVVGCVDCLLGPIDGDRSPETQAIVEVDRHGAQSAPLAGVFPPHFRQHNIAAVRSAAYRQSPCRFLERCGPYRIDEGHTLFLSRLSSNRSCWLNDTSMLVSLSSLRLIAHYWVGRLQS